MGRTPSGQPGGRRRYVTHCDVPKKKPGIVPGL